MPRRDVRAYLLDVVAACQAIVEYAGPSMLTHYQSDKGLRSIVERPLFIVGEAVNHLRRLDPDGVRCLGDVDGIVRVRNILAHIDFGVKHDLIRDIAQRDIPTLQHVAQSWLGRIPQDSA